MPRQKKHTQILSRIHGWLVDALAKSILIIIISKLSTMVDLLPRENMNLVIMIILLILISKF